MAYNYRALPIIGTVPELIVEEIPPLFIQPPKVIQFQKEICKVNDVTVKLCFIQSIAINITSIKKTRLQILEAYSTPAQISELDNHSKSLSFHLLSRLPSFLEFRNPIQSGRLVAWTPLGMVIIAFKSEIDNSNNDSQWTCL